MTPTRKPLYPNPGSSGRLEPLMPNWSSGTRVAACPRFTISWFFPIVRATSLVGVGAQAGHADATRVGDQPLRRRGPHRAADQDRQPEDHDECAHAAPREVGE